MRILGGSIVAIPFGFALLRALTTGTDLRFVWVALASTVAAAIIIAIPKTLGGARNARMVLALVGATAVAAAAGFAQGAHSAQAVLFVALGFAICSVGGLSLLARTH